jgi:hypothetical protein
MPLIDIRRAPESNGLAPPDSHPSGLLVAQLAASPELNSFGS